MLFNSIDFLIFFPIVFLVYYILPGKVRYIWLLLASYYFYMNWNPTYILLLLGCTVLTYGTGRLIEKNHQNDMKKKKIILGTCFVLLLGVLAYFKYFDFLLLNINRLIRIFGVSTIDAQINVLLPVGISFYILQSMGYIMDIYRKEIYAEKNFIRYALFIGFFPQLVAGPIERSKNLLKQLYVKQKLSWNNLCEGFYLILWGLFCKIVIADRIAIIVNTVYENPIQYNGFYIIVATAFFSIQIYCDFYGYSTIARGCAQMLGIRLTDNFNAPYFSKNIKEFWRRWHVSLSGWFRDYLYIPLGGNKVGKVRKEWNLLFVFCISGLWHGASIAYIFWGFLNGMYQVVSNINKQLLNILKEKLHIKETLQEDCFSSRIAQRILTFILISFTWLFFRAGEMEDGLILIQNIVAEFNWYILFDGSLYKLGVEKEYVFVALWGILLLFLVDYQKYQGKNVVQRILAQGWWFKVTCLIGLLFACLLFGCYGELYDTQQFIYFQF